MQKALSNAKVVLNNEAATEEEVKSAVEALEASIQNLETKTATAKKSGSTSRNVSNTYGAAGVGFRKPECSGKRAQRCGKCHHAEQRKHVHLQDDCGQWKTDWRRASQWATEAF